MDHVLLIFIQTYYLNKFFDEKIASHNKEGDDLLSKFSKLTDDNGQPFPVTWLREILINFAVAGRDTTAMLLTWSVYCVMNNPRVLEKLEKEIREVQEIGKMVYLDNIMKETLRLYPSVPSVTRTCQEDDVLPNGVKVYSGDRVSYSILSLHRDPRYWKDPLEFIPERWEDEDVLRHPFQYVPFHMGQMQCLGMHMAQLEAKILLRQLFSSFQFSLVPGQNDKPFVGIILLPESGIMVTVNEK